MITNIMKQKMLSAVKNTKRIELLGTSNEVLSSKEVSWNTSLPTQSYVNLTPVSIASGVDKVPEKVRLVTGTSVDFENPIGSTSNITVYEPYMEDIISKNYPTGTVVGQAYKRGNVVYDFVLYKASSNLKDLLSINHHQSIINLQAWDEGDMEPLYNKIKNEVQGVDEFEMLYEIHYGGTTVWYVSIPLTVTFGVKDKATTLTYNISDYTSSQLNYPEGVQIDVNNLREEL